MVRVTHGKCVKMVNRCSLVKTFLVISARALAIYVIVCYECPCDLVSMPAPQRIFSIHHAHSLNPE